MPTPLVLSPFANDNIAKGQITYAHTFAAALVESDNVNTFNSSAVYLPANAPALLTVNLTTSDVGAGYLTCAPFTFTAVTDLPVVHTVVIYDSQNPAFKWMLGTISTGTVTSLNAGESLTIDFGDTPYANTMLHIANA
jgi:hypothetical protein